VSIDTNGKYYLGRLFDLQLDETTDEPLLYDPDDLTTHAVVVGMTGSGKTGLCLDLLEEAALNKVPALMIDPKGDITNALLHFPELRPADFQPWVNADEARRSGKSVEQAAADTASLWRNGLGGWDIGPERLQALKDSVQFTVFTPGSDAGVGINILASFKAPGIDWDSNREMLREKIAGTVTALLGLAGLKDVDPIRSREHILLANIFEYGWSRRQDLDLGELIMQTQSPPFDKLGVFDINTFFPEKDRFELAMTLNNMLASPAFQTWIEGQPLDVQDLLYMPDGKPRHSVFYIAHLSDAERMFFVALLFSAVETWMRGQSGSTTLRALLYFDEIFGYLPPIGNPPSKESMLRMLKQARAFGVGLVLATQNPVDVDYKALSNAGTWFIGKLQTDQDKQRLLDGLTGASAGLNRREYDDLLSRIGKRVFLLHNVHEKQPTLFKTRWAMNYMAGPATRAQIPALNELAGATGAVSRATSTASATPSATATTLSQVAQPASSQPAEIEETLIGSLTRPAVSSSILEYFLPNNLTLSQAAKESGQSLPAGGRSLGLLYRPVLLAQADIRFLNRKYNLDLEMQRAAIVHEPDRRGVVRWDDFLVPAIDFRQLDRLPVPEARFTSLEEPLTNSRTVKSMRSDFQDWVYRTTEVMVKANESLKVYAGPEVSENEFREMSVEAAEDDLEEDVEKIKASFEKKLDRIKDKLAREKRELKEDEAELSQRKREEGVSHAETILSLFSKRRRSFSSSMTKRRMTGKAKADVEESIEAIEEFEVDLKELEGEMGETLEGIEERWEELAGEITEIPVTPYKKDIDADLFGVAWFPYHMMESAGQMIELPGFGQEE
jgi:hypothetical protein